MTRAGRWAAGERSTLWSSVLCAAEEPRSSSGVKRTRAPAGMWTSCGRRKAQRAKMLCVIHARAKQKKVTCGPSAPAQAKGVASFAAH